MTAQSGLVLSSALSEVTCYMAGGKCKAHIVYIVEHNRVFLYQTNTIIAYIYY